ncbi:MAG: GSCFA domain-containing protein [Dysgonamonadaceae bacterium]
MKFSTSIEIPENGLKICHMNRILLFGSCFSENIGKRLAKSKFQVDINPFGILYNPLSVAVAIKRLLQNKPFNAAELTFRDGLWHSFMHHGAFSNVDRDCCLEAINYRYATAVEGLKQMDILFVTFGTAFVYRQISDGEVVGNCHKFPDSTFSRTRLSVQSIVDEWSAVISELISQNKELKIVFTVSPIRHFKDGAHHNQLSKSTLLLAVDELVNKFSHNVNYFPAFEIVMDELRDYRYYAADMTHLSDVALDYIWERFGESFFDDNTSTIIRLWNEIDRSLNHRPLNNVTDQYKRFQLQTLNKLEHFKNQYPFINCETEYIDLQNSIK